MKRKILFAVLGSFVCQSSYAALDLKIEFENPKRKGVYLNVALTNNTSEEVCVNGAIIGLGGHFHDNLFNVRRIGDAKHVEFYGIQEIRQPQERQGLALLPGRTVTVNLDLSTEYDLSKPGTYSLKYDAWNIATCDRERTGVELMSEEMYFTVLPEKSVSK